MDIAELCKSAYNNQLQQSIHICHKNVSIMAGEHTLTEK